MMTFELKWDFGNKVHFYNSAQTRQSGPDPGLGLSHFTNSKAKRKVGAIGFRLLGTDIFKRGLNLQPTRLKNPIYDRIDIFQVKF